MKEIEKKRLAKNALKDAGIRAYIKDMTRVELHQQDVRSLDGGHFFHTDGCIMSSYQAD